MGLLNNQFYGIVQKVYVAVWNFCVHNLILCVCNVCVCVHVCRSETGADYDGASVISIYCF